MQAGFSKNIDGLLPAIIQDAKTGKVLMLGYMNEESLQKTIDSNKVTFFSRSKQRLWTKGEESGNFLELVSIKLDCDKDTFLIQANPVGAVCHTGSDTCWNEKNEHSFSFLYELENIIADRKINPIENSYTNLLFNKGINKIAQKVGEEAVEVVIEAKDNNDHLFKNETADLLFHLLVLLREKDISLADVITVLQERHK
ncbi:MAG TPA: bifunctional phosphoribosyl-AMP cyclohydrolase/phosphoribosyl-ATP diphosphatase HisIE [Chitinophagales bacterium]|nr:bifunctional phosphoribosyl-AMP cyclohydrolase/phosphoribosyl-ATP diphosphatase HisIE [Chitinophagales bacterium]HMW11531.1 bifunctional phosphoribosyl-AMP cyclohydrolase/phosphoribosyl-ATP diphosphatase HisIE [Chitinophagales bacterium]HMX59251.1 bifunctional phosphoribosyl-AMP cyclohydrolase/phosphoribosyl-ATP diphosphatase HisIE [Chitinophagales bacterium]HMY23823.1 bifunctional phosphoribosyl-AMP cyclohydrolase/phosphoribosyl-ATP diphosphatase HisIE [Chitinophagales bacterium]HMZ32566.1 